MIYFACRADHRPGCCAMGFVIFLAILAAMAGYGLSVYNGLVALRQQVRQAWGDIDALLVQRHDELAQLLEACGRHLYDEQESLQRVTRARASVFQAAGGRDVAAVGAAESLLRSALAQLLAAVEDRPALQADGSFRQLRARVARRQGDIEDRRELYNGAVNLYNVRLGRWPGAMLARLSGLSDATPLEFTGPQRHRADGETRPG